LADGNLLLRTHGGAVPMNSGLQYLSLNLRKEQQVQQKAHIGQTAAELIHDGDSVFLDSSSTALAIAQCLHNRRYVTVITNGLAIAQELLDATGVTVVVTGGTLRRDTASIVGATGLDILKPYNIAKGFFGAHGISLADGLTDVSAEEADTKRPLVAMCREVIAVVDATKWGRTGVSSFASATQIHRVITDAHAPADHVKQIRSAGVAVTLIS
jgi:DeoR/GlpR family transcriptional regulator of sugar metabolism